MQVPTANGIRPELSSVPGDTVKRAEDLESERYATDRDPFDHGLIVRACSLERSLAVGRATPSRCSARGLLIK